MGRRERTWAVCWGCSGVGRKEDGWAQGLPFLIQLVQPKAWSHPRFLSSHRISQIKCRLSVLRAHFPRICVLLGFLLVLRITPTPFSVAYNIPSPGASSSSRAPLLPSSLSRTSLAKHTPIFHLEACVNGLPLPGILKPESSLSSSSKHTFFFLGRVCLTLLSRVCDASPVTRCLRTFVTIRIGVIYGLGHWLSLPPEDKPLEGRDRHYLVHACTQLSRKSAWHMPGNSIGICQMNKKEAIRAHSLLRYAVHHLERSAHL